MKFSCSPTCISSPIRISRPARPGADLLVLAGDIGSYQDRSRLMETDFGLGRFSPARGWPAPVVYVPGNHEYDNLDFDETHDRLRELCHSLDIHWLECETRVMQGVRLVGTTLWTDFDALAQPDEELGSVLKKRAKAFPPPTSTWPRPACAGMANPSWRNRCANRASPASNGWTKRCASPSTASPSSSRTSPHAGQRRSALRRHARHRRLLQCAGRAAAARRLLAARPPAARWTM